MLLTARCPICGRPGPAGCSACWESAAAAPPSACVPAALAFSGVGRQLVLALKYANGRGLARPLAQLMAVQVVGDHDLVTWAPTSAPRRRRRGFDQAELLARAVANELGLPARRMLHRAATGAHQTGRSREERVSEPPRFVARRVRGPLRVLVVDDVVTTGATLLAAQRALLRAGCLETSGVAAAATP